jgi:hypothetical protein
MKKLTTEEFNTRTTEILKASRIFGHITDGNITKAFEIYQEILGEEQLPVFISSVVGGNKAPTFLDGYDRPKCPECGKDMRMRIGAKDPAGKEWKTSWACTDCMSEYYSDKTPMEWMKELEIKDVSE